MYTRRDDLLSIDVADVRSGEELHELLCQAFAFPKYYGRNWDAFDECLRDVSTPGTIRISGLEELKARFPEDARHLVTCLQDFIAISGEQKGSLYVG